jgi:hypothetical protein
MDVLFYIGLSAALVAGFITLLKWTAVEDSEARSFLRRIHVFFDGLPLPVPELSSMFFAIAVGLVAGSTTN